MTLSPDQRAEAETKAHEAGFTVAVREIANGVATFALARERDLYPHSQDLRIEWDRGYDDAVCAYRLGYDIEKLLSAELYVPSLLTTAAVVGQLLDGTWHLVTRPDPRRVQP